MTRCRSPVSIAFRSRIVLEALRQTSTTFMEKIKSGADFGKDDQYDGFELFTQMARANSKLVLTAKAAKKRKTAHAGGR